MQNQSHWLTISAKVLFNTVQIFYASTAEYFLLYPPLKLVFSLENTLNTFTLEEGCGLLLVQQGSDSLRFWYNSRQQDRRRTCLLVIHVSSTYNVQLR